MGHKVTAESVLPAPTATRSQGVTEYLLATGADRDIAFVSGRTRRTYAQLRQDVATLACRLAEAGWDRGAPIAIVAPNGPLWAAAYLATMQTGHVAVPLPTTLPLDEVIARLQWVGAKAVILGGRSARTIAPAVPAGISVFTESAIVADRTDWDGRPRPEIELDDDAAYLFTSGTTGDPRAVRLTHRNIRANTESILGYLPLRRSDRVLVVLPYTYVFGASLLHTHLRVGATLVEQASAAYPETTVELLESERCTVFAGVPSVFHTLLRNSSFVRRRLPDLRVIQQAGGRLPPALLRELLTGHEHAQVFVMYGQTEATARLSALSPELLLAKPGSIGRGIPGVHLRVVNEDGDDVAPGEIGEVRARGENISPGYLNDPEASELKMPSGELHTGDLATVDDERFIFIVDRAEDFIKSWGYRVASQEVEAAVMEVPELISAAAVGVPDDTAGERIEVLAVVRPGSNVSEADILARCRAILPRHAVPAAVHFTERLPLNANGKILKRDIRELLLGGLRPT